MLCYILSYNILIQESVGYVGVYPSDRLVQGCCPLGHSLATISLEVVASLLGMPQFEAEWLLHPLLSHMQAVIGQEDCPQWSGFLSQVKNTLVR